MFPGLILRVLLTALLALPSGPAHAQLAPAQPAKGADASAILLMPLEVAGDIESRARTTFAASLREGLDRSNLALRPPDDDQVETATRCSAPACFEALGHSASATHMVKARVHNNDRIYDIQIEAIDLRSGVVAASSREACEICGIQEVSNQLADQAAALGQKLAEITVRRPTLAVVSHPQGARVLLDGKPVGTTPYQSELAAGQHLVQVQLAQYMTQERSLDAVQGVHEALHFRLQRMPTNEDQAEQKRQRNLRIWGAVTLASGLALAGAGVPLIVLHDRQNTLRCDSGNVDADGNCRWTYDTMDVGLGLTLSGAALATIGVALLSTWGARRKRETSSNARVLPRGLGLAVRF